MFEYGNALLRFRAKLLSSNPADLVSFSARAIATANSLRQDRNFVVSYKLAKDFVGVYEIAKSNSGAYTSVICLYKMNCSC
jgi:hypothetical protein